MVKILQTTVSGSFNWPMLIVWGFSLNHLHSLAIMKPVIQELFCHKMVGPMFHFIFTKGKRAQAIVYRYSLAVHPGFPNQIVVYYLSW